MPSPLRPILRRVTSSRLDLLIIAQLLSFAAAPALLVAGVRTVVRLATTPVEILLGVLASSTLALLLVILGLVLPLSRKPEA